MYLTSKKAQKKLRVTFNKSKNLTFWLLLTKKQTQLRQTDPGFDGATQPFATRYLCNQFQVILAVIRRKDMRTNRNVLIVNLALSNLMLALTTIPFLWLPSIDFEFPYSKFFCKFANALPGSNIYCSTLTISVMAIDRLVFLVIGTFKFCVWKIHIFFWFKFTKYDLKYILNFV